VARLGGLAILRVMEQRLTVITLGVSDVARARAFYCDGLGWTAAPSSNDDIVFIPVGQIVLALYPRQLLAEDARLPPGGGGFDGVTLAQNVATKAEVDAALAKAAQAGARISKPAEEVSWGGYSGYFLDLDGHAWEIAYNPLWGLTPDGRVSLPG
jgi:catechol 2,3-dioxygenase-like lactoylglutathione lyase family enzyme